MPFRAIPFDRNHVLLVATLEGLSHPSTRSIDDVVAAIEQVMKCDGEREPSVLAAHRAIVAELHGSCCEIQICTREVHLLRPEWRLPVMNAFSKWRQVHMALAS